MFIAYFHISTVSCSASSLQKRYDTVQEINPNGVRKRNCNRDISMRWCEHRQDSPVSCSFRASASNPLIYDRCLCVVSPWMCRAITLRSGKAKQSLRLSQAEGQLQATYNLIASPRETQFFMSRQWRHNAVSIHLLCEHHTNDDNSNQKEQKQNQKGLHALLKIEWHSINIHADDNILISFIASLSDTLKLHLWKSY